MTTPTDKQATRPFSLRFTEEERQTLERRAAGVSLATFIRAKLFEADAAPRRSRGKFPLKDHRALSQILGKLGESKLADSLAVLSRASRLGALQLSPETEEALRTACMDITTMKSMLMKALGIQER